jgi:hypothetical protein
MSENIISKNILLNQYIIAILYYFNQSSFAFMFLFIYNHM